MGTTDDTRVGGRRLDRRRARTPPLPHHAPPVTTAGERRIQGRRHVLDGVKEKAVDARRGNEPPPSPDDLR